MDSRDRERDKRLITGWDLGWESMPESRGAGAPKAADTGRSSGLDLLAHELHERRPNPNDDEDFIEQMMPEKYLLPDEEQTEECRVDWQALATDAGLDDNEAIVLELRLRGISRAEASDRCRDAESQRGLQAAWRSVHRKMPRIQALILHAKQSEDASQSCKNFRVDR